MLRLKTTTRKVIQAAAVLTHLEGGRVDRIRLLKLLYIADREALANTGAPIIGGRVVALDNGPLHSDVYDMIKGEHDDFREWNEHFTNDGHAVVLKADTDRLALSQFEIEKLTSVYEDNRRTDTWELVEKTHLFPEWQSCHVEGSSKTIPLERILGEVGFSPEDIEYIQKEAAAHKRMNAILSDRQN